MASRRVALDAEAGWKLKPGDRVSGVGGVTWGREASPKLERKSPENSHGV